MYDDSSTTIDILRHGHCEGGDIYRGSSNVALSARGWREMQQSADSVSADWDAMSCSPFQRCRSFAEAVAKSRQLELRIDDQFRETDFGEWEGRNRTQVWNEDKQRVKLWWNDAVQHPPPGGEDTSEFFQRVQVAIDQLFSQHDGKHVGLVTHGGVIRVLLSQLVGRGANGMNDWHVPYACVTRLRRWSSTGNVQLVFHNR